MSITATAKVAKRLKTDGVLNGARKVNRNWINRVKRDFAKTVSTWETPAKFQQRTRANKREFSASVFTKSDVWRFLNYGTQVRYAHMSDDFSPKTRPGVLQSGPGRGGRLYVDVSDPLDGIEARLWTQIVNDKRGPEYIKEMQEVMANERRKSGHAL